MDYYVIDLDGPNYPFLKNLAIAASQVTGRPLEEFGHVQDEWSAFLDNWDITLEQFYVIYALGVKNGDLLWEGDPVDGSVQGWTDLAARPDTYLHVVTDRNPFGVVREAHEATHYWLATNGLYFDQISFRHDKVAAVLANMDLMGLDHHDVNVITIDDKPMNCIKFEKAGFLSYVYDEPSNRFLDMPRVRSMIELAQLDTAAVR